MHKVLCLKSILFGGSKNFCWILTLRSVALLFELLLNSLSSLEKVRLCSACRS